jgi:uncharacterized protein YneF (UPF0154 family)
VSGYIIAIGVVLIIVVVVLAFMEIGHWIKNKFKKKDEKDK